MKKNMHVLLISVLTLGLLLTVGCGSKQSLESSESPSVSADPSVSVGTSASSSPGSESAEASSSSADPSAETSAAPSSEPSANPSAKPSASPQDSSDKYAELGWALMEKDGLGSLKLRLSASDLVTLMGEPEWTSDPEVWSADGLEHLIWSYPSKGLDIGMAKQPDDTEAFIFSLSASAPCNLETNRGIKLGDTKDAVMSAYKNELDPAANDDTESWIVLGSVFGGMGIGIENGIVNYIFIGSSAE